MQVPRIIVNFVFHSTLQKFSRSCETYSSAYLLQKPVLHSAGGLIIRRQTKQFVRLNMEERLVVILKTERETDRGGIVIYGQGKISRRGLGDPADLMMSFGISSGNAEKTR